MLISEIYHPNPETIHEDMRLDEVVQKMVREEFNGYVVVNSDHHVVGILSLQDVAAATIPTEFKQHLGVARAMYKKGFFHESCQAIKDRPVSWVMRKKFITADLNTSIMSVIADFLENDLYIVPVVEDGKLLGVVTRTEVKKALARGMNIALS